MKIALITCYQEESYGARILSSCLKREGHSVSLFFLPNFFLDAYKQEVLGQLLEKTEGCELIGISLMTNNFDNAIQLTKAFKEERKDLVVVWGGVHPTIRPEECLDYADAVCVGEAEVSIIKLARRIEMRDPSYLEGIPGVGFKKGKTKVLNGMGDLAFDLDALPWPDYSLENHYRLEGDYIRSMDVGLFKAISEGTYITFSTRGCPFSCTYCFNSTWNRMYDRKTCLRKRSLDNVLAELSAMKQKFPFIARIIFDDDNFLMYTREEIERFSIDYKAKIGLPLFIGGLSPETVNREKLSFLVNAGLEEVRLGVQSGSVITRKLYNRNHSNDMLWRAVQTFQFFREKLKQINYDIIVDNPWEEEDNIVESLLFIAKIPYPRHLIIYSLTFFPGTELYDRAKQEGIINDDLTDVYRKFYHSVKRTYLNEIFYLLDDKIVKRDKGWMIPLLTCKMFRRIKPIWLIRLLREPGRILRQYLRQGATLLKEGVICLLRGEWGRIWRYMRYSTKK